MMAPDQSLKKHVADLIKPDRVHRDIYTDPDIFDLEMDTLFSRAWMYVGHVSQIPNKGDYITTRLGPQDVIIMRDNDGEVNIFHNRCPHRGPHLCGNSRGNTKRIVCPYHAWSFTLKGKFFGMPFPEEYPQECLKSEFDLTRVEDVEIYRGFIFARLKPGGVDLMTYLGEARSGFDDIIDRSPEGEIEIIPGAIGHRYRANWKMMFENLNDILHPMGAHASAATAINSVSNPAKLHPVTKSLVGSSKMMPVLPKLQSKITRYGHSYATGLISVINQEIPKGDHYHALEKAYGAARAEEILKTDRHLMLIYPSSNVNGAQCTIRVVRPLSVNETEVWGYAFRLKGAPEEVTRNSVFYCNIATSGFSPVVADDLEIYERAQQVHERGMTDWVNVVRGYRQEADAGRNAPPPATSEEYIRNQYRVWLEFLTGDAPCQA